MLTQGFTDSDIESPLMWNWIRLNSKDRLAITWIDLNVTYLAIAIKTFSVFWLKSLQISIKVKSNKLESNLA